MAVNVPFVSVSYDGTRPEELAYRDGAFVYPYLESTRVGDTFSLRRTGGWPSDPTVHVEEAAPGGVPPWRTLYHVDFRTLPSASFSAAGECIIDGLSWWQKPGYPTANGPVTIGARGMLMGTSGTGEFSPSFAARRMVLPLANIPGYNPAAPVVIYTRTDASADGAVCVVGVMDCAANASAPTSAEYERRQGVSRDPSAPPTTGGAKNHYIWNHKSVANGTSPLLANSLTEVQGGRVIVPVDRRSVIFSAFDWSGTAPTPTSGTFDCIDNGNSMNLLMLGYSSLAAANLLRDMNNLSFYAAYNNSVGPDRSAWLCELMVWQPGAGS